MIRVARGTTEIEGVELDEGRILFDATFTDAPGVGTHTYSTPDADAGPEHPLHGLYRRRHGAAAFDAGAELLRWGDSLSSNAPGAIRRSPVRVLAALVAKSLVFVSLLR